MFRPVIDPLSGSDKIILKGRTKVQASPLKSLSECDEYINIKSFILLY